ncbi:SWR1 complex subunit 2 isoform X1 [Mercurialis annua]|uniref:SWR1 complex subunit 2 isoform X1 n=1 Tax=Mercurialis annua TaxID=3986 RepID=UPI00215E3E14|nr:SWR1 complex subunit 2 isoform X1 [Mercurialis annua]
MEISNQEEEEKAAPIVFLDRASRQTRGKRMTKLLDEENEEDDLFWNQDALLEEENDNNYDEEPEIADEFDSDFDDNESEPDEEAQNVPDERKQKRKRLVYPGKPSTKKKKKKKVLSNLGEESKDEKLAEDSTAPEHHDAGDDGEGERIVRKSTRTSVIVRQAERDAISAALQATMKQPIKRKKVGEEKRMTQEEMLLEAAQTEIMNLRNLERVLAREEEVKKRAIVHKAVYNGPQIRYFSKDGCSYLEFRGISFQSEISVASNPYPEKPVCAITGLPAKYRDPKTGLPYATKEAFKIIRARYEDENNIKKEMDMGVLSDSLNGKGFSGRRKRIPNSNRRKLPNFSYMSQFGKAPTIEIDSSE